jgi:HSP20 family protein
MARIDITSRPRHPFPGRATFSPPCARKWSACSTNSNAVSLAGRLSFGAATAITRSWCPEFDVRENTDAITIEAELPGVDEKDVTVTMANGILTIKGEKKQEKEERNENYYLSERSYGAFERSPRLPDTIDDAKVEAKFDKGLLKVTAAKKPDAVKAERKIEIQKAS